MISHLRSALVSLVMLTLVTGVVYPVAVTAAAQAIFPRQANGSMIDKKGRAAGSSLIGQPFDDPKYFWGRLSATSPYPYDAASSGGSNLGPTNPALVDEAKARVDALHAADPDNAAPIPVDLVTSSGSGLDPEISPAAAEYQAARVAKARGLDPARVRSAIAAHTSPRQLGILGEPRVNVLELNLAIDDMM